MDQVGHSDSPVPGGVLSRVEVFDRALSALELAHAAEDSGAALVAAREALRDLGPADLLRVAGALSMLAVHVPPDGDLAGWLARLRLEHMWSLT